MIDGKILVLTGGVGGAKLCLGLQRILPSGSLNIIVNTGDDFDHIGLRICPDIDTTLYTLGGLANQEQGWGREGESWNFMHALAALGGETWFRLGDGDLAIHLERTRRLAAGEPLGDIIADFAARFAISSRITPMSNDRVSTIVITDEGRLGFQDYFVRRSCTPIVHDLEFDGADRARIPDAVRAMIEDEALQAIIIAPSNPYLSVAPILAIPGLADALRASGAPIVAVSPIIDGAAVKGPTAKIMGEMGVSPSALSIAEFYRGILDGIVLDTRDVALTDRMSLPVITCETLMMSQADKERVAGTTIEFALTLQSHSACRA